MAKLFESASCAVKVRRAYAKRGRAYNHKFFTYALLLQDDNVYVGTTNNIYARLLEHDLMSPSSSLWVREHGPVKRVLEITVDAPPDAEAERTLHFMNMFGWRHVRGAGWCRVRMLSPPAALEKYVQGEMTHRFMSRADVDDVVDKVAVLAARLDSDSDSD